jgi:hypothetical protein
MAWGTSRRDESTASVVTRPTESRWSSKKSSRSSALGVAGFRLAVVEDVDCFFWGEAVGLCGEDVGFRLEIRPDLRRERRELIVVM